MKIILIKSVETLGEAGDIVNVKPGYGRNYIIPQRLGILATKSTIKSIKKQIDLKEMKEAKTKKGLQLITEKLNSIKLTFDAKVGEDDKLFGSVTTQMISSELNNKGIKVEKKYISLVEPIKSLGNYFAIIDFGDDIQAKIKIKVVAEKEK